MFNILFIQLLKNLFKQLLKSVSVSYQCTCTEPFLKTLQEFHLSGHSKNSQNFLLLSLFNRKEKLFGNVYKISNNYSIIIITTIIININIIIIIIIIIIK